LWLSDILAIQNIGGSGSASDVGVEAFLILATFTAIVVAASVFAYLRYFSAMIVGCLVWMFPIAALVLYYDDTTRKPFGSSSGLQMCFCHIRYFGS
jgi:hypothetical protein